jgi:Domain of unknown function (DUF1707)
MAGTEHGRLRASHGDRDRVIETLKAAYVHGCLTKDEFDARVSQTLASRTHAELALVTADLPAGLTAAPPPTRSARARRAARAGASWQPGDRPIMATAVLSGLALIASVLAPTTAVAGLPLAGLLLLTGVGSAFVSLFLLRIQLRGSRRDTRLRRPAAARPGR